MRFLFRLSFCLLLFQFLSGNSLAASRDEMKAAIESRYRITVPGFFGNFKEIGSVLVARKEGLRVDRPMAFFRANVIKNGQIATAGGGEIPLGNDVDSNLRTGDRLYLYKIETGDDYVELVLFTVKEFIVTGSGTKGPIQLQASTRFRYDGGLASVTVKQVLDDIGAWFSVEGAAAGRDGGVVNAPLDEAPKATGKDETGKDDISTKTVKLGQTPEEVIAIMGQPDGKILLGPKSVFVYRNMKLIFIDGKLTDAE